MRIIDVIGGIALIVYLVICIGVLGMGSSVIGEMVNSDYEEIPKTAVVYELSHTPPMIKGYSHISEQYNIYLEYEDNIYCIEDEDTFNQLQKGDSVEIILHERRTSKGELLDWYVTLAE